MSILSKNQFDKLCATLDSLQQQLNEESKGIENKICLSLAKIDYLQERLETYNPKNLNENAEQLLKIHQKMARSQKNIAKLHEKYQADLNTKKQQLLKSILDIERNWKQSQQKKASQLRYLQEKLDTELKQLQKEFNRENHKEDVQIKSLEKKFLKQLQACEEKILANRKKIEQNQSILSQKIQEMFIDLEERIKYLKEVRKSKKANFLELLQAVIVKIKQVQTVEI